MTSPDPDRLRYAQIAGAVARHALGWRLTADEEAVAVAELTEAAAGRADLLAERAGTALGFGAGRPDAARYRQIAELCIAAGADPALIERWITVGRDRAAAATAIPYTGLPPGGLLLLVAGLDERGRGRANVLRAADGGAHLAGAAVCSRCEVTLAWSAAVPFWMMVVVAVTATAVVGTSSSAAMIPATSQPVVEMFLILDMDASCRNLSERSPAYPQKCALLQGAIRFREVRKIAATGAERNPAGMAPAAGHRHGHRGASILAIWV